MQTTREQLYNCLTSLGISPTYNQLTELVKISQRYHRNKSKQVDRKALLKSLLSTYKRLVDGEPINDHLGTISVALMALKGYVSNCSNEIIKESFEKASAEVFESSKKGRPYEPAKEILLTDLCLVYKKMFGKFPPCRHVDDDDDVDGHFVGHGLDYVYGLWKVITLENTESNSIGRYIKKAKSSKTNLKTQLKSRLRRIIELNHP